MNNAKADVSKSELAAMRLAYLMLSAKVDSFLGIIASQASKIASLEQDVMELMEMDYPDLMGGVGSSAPQQQTMPLVFSYHKTDTLGDPIPANCLRIADGYAEGRYGYLPVIGTIVAVGGSVHEKHLIVAEGDENGGAVVSNSISEYGFAGDTATQWRRVLYRVYLEDNAVVIDFVAAGAWGIVL